MRIASTAGSRLYLQKMVGISISFQLMMPGLLPTG